MTDKERLLTDTLDDGAGATFARAAAAHVRRRRAIRQAGLGLAVVALAALFFFLRAPALRPASVPQHAPAYEIISDQELLAQLKDRPALFLKDQTGITGVVFLAENNAAVRF